MIFADSKYLGVTPSPIENAKPVDGLCETTGASILISKNPVPPVGPLLSKHAEGKSIFIVIADFPSAATERNIRKLIGTGALVKQVIVRQTVLDYGGDQAWQDNKSVGQYSKYVQWLAHLSASGITSVNIADSYIDSYVKELEANMNKDEYFIPVEVREYKPLTDGSVTLATIPAIGYANAKKIYKAHKDSGSFNLIDTLALYSNQDKCKNSLMSESACAGIRKWLGIPDGWNITLEPSGKGE